MSENADVVDILDILRAEMVLATGCTEPAAIAFVSAVAAGHMNGERAEGITVRASGNMLKNAMAAGIPGTPYTGVAYAAAIGASGGDADAKLQVFDHIAPEAFTAAEAMVNGGDVEILLADQPEKLYVDVTLRGPTHTARAVISGSHTNVSLIEEDGRLVFGGGPASGEAERVDDGLTEKESSLSVRRIFEFVSGLDPGWSGLRIIRDSIAINSAISEEGLKNDYGLMIGKMMLRDLESGVACDDMIGRAVRATTAGADARMAGAPFPVISNSGSGNQGITATMPVVEVAAWLESGDDKLIRAVTLSNLIAIYIKSRFGKLSALCGATVAATGAACGVAYLLGGDLRAIESAIQNMVGNVSGMICDGAKADCALKIYSCTHAAMQAAIMASHGMRVQKTDGINDEDVEKSIANFAALSSGSGAMDAMILDMMLSKDRK